MVNRPFVVAVVKKGRKKSVQIFPCHMYKTHSGGPALTNFGDKARAHCFILSFQWHEMGSEAWCMILSWEPGKHPAQEKLLQMCLKRNPGRPCVLCLQFQKCRRLLETLDSDHCSVFLMLHHMFPSLLFLIVVIFDRGHLSVNKCSNGSALSSFSGFPKIYTSDALLATSWCTWSHARSWVSLTSISSSYYRYFRWQQGSVTWGLSLARAWTHHLCPVSHKQPCNKSGHCREKHIEEGGV